MKLALDPRARWLLRRLPLDTPYALASAALVVLIAVQSARLFWLLIVPMGPVGDWRAAPPLPPADSALLARFDPFFRLTPANAAPSVVSSLPLKLFGVRVDQAAGRGSAIIQTPDGVQSSFAVGDEVVPGVKLQAVAMDSVTLDRGGALEQIFLDQTKAPQAVVAGAPGAPAAPPPPPAATAPTVQSVQNDIAFAVRTEGGQVTGLVVNPKGSGNAFRAAGLEPGDVVTSVNGTPLRDPAQAPALIGQVPQTGIVTFTVIRNGQTITVNAQTPQ